MTQSKVTNVGIAGATGRFGSLVLDALFGNSDIKVRALCRNASKLDPRYSQSAQLEVVEGDVLDLALLTKFVDSLDVVICTYLGDNNFTLNAQKALIDVYEAAKVPRYLSSDYTFDYTKLEYGEHPSKDPVKKMHECLEGKQHVHGVHQPEEKKLVYWGSGEEVWEFITYPDAAKYTAAVALDPSAIGLQRCKLREARGVIAAEIIETDEQAVLGDKKTILEIAQAFQKAYGYEPTLQREGSIDELYTRLQRLLSQDPADVYAWLPFCYQYHILNGRLNISNKLDNAKYPQVVPQSFQDFLDTHAVEELAGSMEALGKMLPGREMSEHAK